MIDMIIDRCPSVMAALEEYEKDGTVLTLRKSLHRAQQKESIL
jgi:hypothetical protein